jgi:hypothetical protein
MLPNLQTEVRITRQEFEALIRPSLLDSLEAMRRAVRSAGLEFDDVSRVLLVGGSSRIPLIAQLVSSQLGRPVGVDAHPKHAVAIGASLAASGLLERAAADAGAAEGVPLDPLVTVVATPEELAGARQSVRAQVVPQAGPGKAQPVPPAVVRAMPAPQAGPGKAQPVPPAVVGGAMPAPPLGSPGKAQPVPPAVVGGVMPAPQAGPGKAQPVANPGPPPQADGPSGRHGGPSPG